MSFKLLIESGFSHWCKHKKTLPLIAGVAVNGRVVCGRENVHFGHIFSGHWSSWAVGCLNQFKITLKNAENFRVLQNLTLMGVYPFKITSELHML